MHNYICISFYTKEKNTNIKEYFDIDNDINRKVREEFWNNTVWYRTVGGRIRNNVFWNKVQNYQKVNNIIYLQPFTYDLFSWADSHISPNATINKVLCLNKAAYAKYFYFESYPEYFFTHFIKLKIAK